MTARRVARVGAAVALAALAAAAGLPSVAFATEQIVFGPSTYTRASGPPNIFVDTFGLPSTLIAPFRIHVQNGDTGGGHRVSSATITMNGAQAAGPSDLHQQVAGFDRTVSLQASNTLQVRLASAPGSFLVVTIFGTVPPPVLAGLVPPILPVSVGGTGALTATITPAQPRPTVIALSSDPTAVATVPPTATVPAHQTTVAVPVSGVAPGQATITASLNNTSAHSTITVAPAGPTISALGPQTIQVTQSASGTLTVTISAAQATDTLVTLATSDATIVALPPAGTVTVPGGQTSQAFAVFGVAPGPATITASLNGTSAHSQVTVVTPLPTVVSLLPPVVPLTEGSSGTLSVTLNATQPTDTAVALSTSDATIVGLPPGNTVTVPAHALSASFAVTGLTRGTATVTAALNGTQATAAVEVQPPAPTVQALACPATLAAGATALCTVTLNATQLTTTLVPLASSAPGIASVPPSVTVPANALTAQFAVTGVAASATPATLTAGPLNATSKMATVQVVPPAPALVSLGPSTATIFVGATAQLTLTLNAAQLADTAVPLSSSAPGTASVPPTATVPAGSLTTAVTVTGVAPGQATLTAGPLDGTSAQSTITVNQLPPTVTALTPALSLPKGRAGTLTVTIAPTQPDPTIVPLTSSDPPTVEVPQNVTVPAGASTAAFPVLANQIGSATITAGPLNGTSQQATVTVTPPELVTLAVTPATATIAKGQSQQFTATGTFTDTSTQDLTGTAAWTSSDPSVATVTSPGGVATGLSPGSTTIAATVGSRSATATLTVTPPILASVAISPANPTRNVGQTLQFTATGTLTDGTTQDLTQQVTWASSDPGVATIASPGGLATAVAPGPTTITASLALPAGSVAGSTTLTVILAPPTITSFTPTSGQVGTSVTITGANFVTVQSVTFNNVPVPVPIPVPASPTSITVTVPTGATTGPIAVTTAAGTGTSLGQFIVLPTQDFQLTALPNTVNVAAAGQGSFTVGLSASGGFTALATLNVTGVPAGATTTFAATNLTAGQTTSLTAVTNGTTAAGSYALTVRGSGQVNGVQTTRTAKVTLQVQPAGQTSLTGQVLDEDAKPVKGAVIKLGTLQTATDDAGNFFLVNPPVGPDQLMFIDGGPASTAGKSFPVVPYKVTIVAGQANTLGFTPHLHFQKTTGLVDISNSSVQRLVTQPDIPGFQMTIPVGVTITGWDGQPNTVVSVRKISLDRSPTPPMPPGLVAVSAFMDYFGKPGGGTPSAPVPITFPNDMGLPPGTQVELWFYDEAPDGSRPNQWAQYGTGTVSADGSQVIPDTDPKTGKPFGQPRFCCGEVRYALREQARDALNSLRGGTAEAAERTTAGEPVNLSTGTFSLEKTDLVLPGRLPLVFTRTYRTNGAPLGPFGAGTSHSYFIFLLLEGNLRTLVLPTGARLAFPQQADGSFRNFTDPSVRGAVLTAAAPGHVLRFKDGTTWAFGQPFAGSTVAFLVRQADRNGNTVTLTYTVSRDNPIGQLVAITEPAGRQLTLTYEGDNSPRITSITDPIGRTVTYTYGPGGLASVTDPAGGVTRYTYDAQNRMTSITDPRGITFITNEYDATGRVAKQTQADGGVWQFAYTVVAGTVTQTVVTDPRGNPTTHRFNGQGYLLAQTDALGQTTTLTRDPATNLLLATTDPLGRVTRFTYDAAGNVTAITDPAGNARALTYEPTFNRVTSVTDPLGNVTRFEYGPANGNLLKITDSLGAVTQIAYNAFGQPMSTTDALGNVAQFAYNSQGDLATIADPLGNTTTREYDQASRLVRQLDPRGKPTAFEYDPMNRLTSLVDALAAPTAFTYDANGNLLTVTDARGNTITHAYDPMDRLSQRVDQLGAPETFTYDANGNLVSTTDRKGQITTFVYDKLNRRTQSTFADGAVATFTYDPAGRLTQADDTADPHRPIAMAYDNLDRLVAETTALGTVGYQYDALGRRTTMTVSGQSPVTYTYDGTSQLRTITQAPLNPVDIQYDALGRRTLLTLPNTVSTEYQYDAASRLTALVYRNAAGPVGDLTYQYDPAGNRVAVGGAFARTLLPDPVPSATYDAANRQLAFGGRSMTYDSNGNLETLTEGGNTTTFTWDRRNRLMNVSGLGPTASFAYDARGRRSSSTINAQTTTFQYDVAGIVREIMGAREVHYLHGRGIDEPLARIEVGANSHYLGDALGSTTALTDSGGAITTTYSYGPFGESQAIGASSANPFQYTGRENDGTGLYYYRARYFHPQLARFISPDPIGLQGGGANFYAYVGNRPTSFTDPYGLWFPRDHERLTREEALGCGLSPEDARRMVEANSHVDAASRRPWNENTLNPGSPAHAMPGSPWRQWTGDRLREAIRRDAAGNRPGAIDALGEGLHGVQDAWAHDLRNPPGTMSEHKAALEYPDDVIHPDDPVQNPYSWELARGATRRYLIDFMRARGLKPKCALPEF